MSKGSAFLLIAAAVALLSAAVLVPGGEAAMSCSMVYNALMPCMNYLNGGPIEAGCCGGVKSLLSAATATADRQAICSCLKSVASGIAASVQSRAAGIPGKCGIPLPYKFNPNINCASIK